MKPDNKGNVIESEKLQDIENEINVSSIGDQNIKLISQSLIQDRLKEDGVLNKIKVEDVIPNSDLPVNIFTNEGNKI